MKRKEYTEKHINTEAGFANDSKDDVKAVSGEKKTRAWVFWLVSIAVNAAILFAVLHFAPMYYETNDDYSIACKIAEGYPYVGFVNYYLCRVLIVIQKAFTGVNVFMLSQIVMSFIAFTAVFRVLIERSRELTEWLLAAVVIAFFSFDHYSAIQFTKTSALLMAAGLVCVADAYTRRRSILAYIGGFLLYFIGVCYRQMGMFPAISYIFLFMLVWWILNGREYFKGKKPVLEIGLVLVIVALLVAPYAFDMQSDRMNASTPELALAREYQAERIKITDYPLVNNYEKFRDEYDAAGISENDILTIDRFVLDYDGAASLENLKTINKINAPALSSYMTVKKAVKKFVKKTVKALRERSFTGMHIIALAFICVFMLLTVRPKSWLYIPLIGALTVALYIVIYYNQRTNYRAFYVADVSAAFWLLYVIMAEGKEPGRKAWRKWTGRLLCILAAAALLTLFPKAVKIENAKATHNNSVVASEEVAAYLEAHPDKFYVMPTPIQKWPATYLEPLAPAKMQDNCTNTGGWEAMTPSRLNFLAEHGMSNPVKDLIDNPDALMFGKYKKDMLLEYYNKWYGSEDKKIVFEKEDEVAGIEIYRVVSVD